MRYGFFDGLSIGSLPVGSEARIGKKREDMPWVEEEFDKEFRQYIIDFPKEQLPQVYELLEKYKEDKKIFIFKSREEAEEYLKKEADS